MTPEQYRRVGELYHAAMELAPEARVDFLAGACGGDDELRREVESLLQARQQADGFITGKVAGVVAEMAAQQQNLSLVGRSISHYQVLSLLGAGGMGEVYLAQDTSLGRKVALKLLPPAFTRNQERVRRFEREARAVSALNHPNILTIYEVGIVGETHFIATEFIDGQTLRERLRDGRLELSEALDLAIQTASALVAAHEAGIVHRDIKPENVMVRPDGLIKVLDFGLAKLAERQLPPTDPQASILAKLSTEPGVVMGTVSYMSPEQARGEKVDARADIFSLGVVFYEMTTGRAPFVGRTTGEMIAVILRDEPLPLTSHAPDAPPELERIVGKALRKNREERYQSANDLLVDLKQLQRDLEFAAVQYGKRERLAASNNGARQGTRTVPAGRYWRAMIAFVATLVMGATVFGVYRFIEQNQAETDPTNPFSEVRFTRLTGTGKAIRAAISPDGKYFVHVLSEAGKQRLLFRQVALSKDLVIVPPAEAVYRGLTFSRDGTHIYYVLQHQNNPKQILYRVQSLGGVSRKVLEDIDSPVTISPDSKQLAFVRRNRAQVEDQLIIADLDGGNERVLASRKGADFFGTGGPAWSPDGKIIACAAGSNTGGRHMYVAEVRVDNGQERPISDGRWATVGRVSWMGDGSGLIIGAIEQSSWLAQVWYAPYPKGAPRRITNDLNGYGDVTLTGDSHALVAVQSEAHVNVWLMNSNDANRARKITDSIGDGKGLRGLTWTPDGRLVYVSRASGSHDIWLMDQDGRNQTQLTTVETRAEFYPAVSPDGRYIVFVSTRTGTSNLYRYDLSTGDQKQLTNGAGEEFPVVSSDGKWVIYTATGSVNFTLWKVPIDGGELAQLTDRLSQWPDVSPDGRKIACWYRAEPQASWQIAVLPISGGAPERVLDVPPTAETPIPIRWMPDGGGISFADTRDGASNIWRLPVDGGAPKQLTSFTSDQISWFDWSRDGKQLALSRGSINSDVVLISNFK